MSILLASSPGCLNGKVVEIKNHWFLAQSKASLMTPFSPEK